MKGEAADGQRGEHRPWRPKRGRNPKGLGAVIVKVDARGYATYVPRVTVDGVHRWGEGVGAKRLPGQSVEQAERRAWLAADQNRKRLLRDLAENTYSTPRQRAVELRAVLEDWYRAVDTEKRSVGTRRKYREELGWVLAHVGGALPGRLADVRPEHLRAWHEKMRKAGAASSVVQNAHIRLVQALRWAKRQPSYRGAVDESLVDGAVERPGHVPHETKSVTPAEALRLIAAMADVQPFGPLVAVMYYQGLRDGEASGLKWGDVGIDGVDLKRQRERKTREEVPPKWRSSGWLPLLPQAKDALEGRRRWCEANGVPCGPGDWVFAHRRGRRAPWLPPAYNTTWQRIKDGCRAAGLDDRISAHALRRGFADAANEAGVSTRDLAELLRHDPVVTLRYQSRDISRLRESAGRIGKAMGGQRT